MATEPNDLVAAGAMLEGCICTDWCDESRSDNPCPYCRELDIYEPCPVIGYGCGVGATERTDPCDCCAPEQWAAAMGLTVERVVAGEEQA